MVNSGGLTVIPTSYVVYSYILQCVAFKQFSKNAACHDNGQNKEATDSSRFQERRSKTNLSNWLNQKASCWALKQPVHYGTIYPCELPLTFFTCSEVTSLVAYLLYNAGTSETTTNQNPQNLKQMKILPTVFSCTFFLYYFYFHFAIRCTHHSNTM